MKQDLRMVIDAYFQSRGFLRDENSHGYRLPLESRINGKRNIIFVSDELIEDNWEKVKEVFRESEA